MTNCEEIAKEFGMAHNELTELRARADQMHAAYSDLMRRCDEKEAEISDLGRKLRDAAIKSVQDAGGASLKFTEGGGYA